MNIWRGLFRLWVLATVLWLGLVVAVSYNPIVNPWLPIENYLVPDTTRGLFKLDSYSVSQEIRNSHREIKFPNNVYVYATLQIPDSYLNQLAPEFMRGYVEPRNQLRQEMRKEAVLWALAFAVLVPLVVLLLGCAFRWVAAGFGAPRT